MNEQEALIIALKNSKDSWKDEFWTIILAIPLVFCFYPPAVEHIKAGFDALDAMPEWYRYTLVSVICISFGLKHIKK